jgi:hypothetical protein
MTLEAAYFGMKARQAYHREEDQRREQVRSSQC